MYINTRLSDAVAFGFSGGPEWSTSVVQLDNGREVRNGQWMYPRHRYSAQFMNLLEAARNELIAAFHAARGRLHCFRFKDWNDYVAEAQAILPEIGTTDPVQLIKTYWLGSASSTRLIQAPVSCIVRNSSGAQVAGSVDLGTGLFTPDAVWAADSYTWSGEFDIWVRFDSDYNAFVIGNKSGQQFVATADIELVEIRR